MVRKYGKRNRYGDRYVARNANGQLISNVDVGRSLKQDRARKAKYAKLNNKALVSLGDAEASRVLGTRL